MRAYAFMACTGRMFKLRGTKWSWHSSRYHVDTALRQLKTSRQIGVTITEFATEMWTRDVNVRSRICGYATATQTIVSDYCAGIQQLLKAGIHLNLIQKIRAYLLDNTMCVHYKHQSANTVSGTNRWLFWKPYEAHKCIVHSKLRGFLMLAYNRWYT
jgi:hypothetical protein